MQGNYPYNMDPSSFGMPNVGPGSSGDEVKNIPGAGVVKEEQHPKESMYNPEPSRHVRLSLVSIIMLLEKNQNFSIKQYKIQFVKLIF